MIDIEELHKTWNTILKNQEECKTAAQVSGLPHYKRFSVMFARRRGAWFKNTLFVAAAKRQFNSFYTTKSV